MTVNTKSSTIEEILLLPDQIPVMSPKTLVKEALELMTEKRLGIACILENNVLIGIFTDGDLRRLLLKTQKPNSALFADDIITHARKNFTTINRHTNLTEALELLQSCEIFDLPVTDDKGCLEGIIHLHPALKELMTT